MPRPYGREPIPQRPDFRDKLLGGAQATRIFQERPAGLAPAILAQPRADQFVIVTQLIVTKVKDGGPFVWYAYVDYDGVETNEDTAIVWKKPISYDSSPHAIELSIVLLGGQSSLSVQSGEPGGINFTAIGWVGYRE